MKKTVKKVKLSRETLRDLDARQVTGGGDDARVETQPTAGCPTRLTCGVLIGD